MMVICMCCRLFFGKSAIGGAAIASIALLLAACSQPQATTTTPPPTTPSPTNQSPTPAAKETAPPINLGIQRVTLASLKPKANNNSTDRKIVLPQVQPLELKGRITVAGSPLVFPISDAISQRFKLEGYPDSIEVASLKETDGFALFCEQGKADIVQTSRPISESEAQACAKTGRKPIAFTIATDEVTVVVSAQNEFVPESLTEQQLKQLFTATRWSQINPDWSDEAIQRVIPSPSDGAFKLFANAIFVGDENLLAKAPNTKFFDDPQQVVEEGLTNANTLGFLERAYYANNKNALRAIAIDGKAASTPTSSPTPAAPAAGSTPTNSLNPATGTAGSTPTTSLTPATGTAGSLPTTSPTPVDATAASTPNNNSLTRSLYIYADENQLRSRPELRGFITYYLANVNEEIPRLGYFPASPTVFEESKTKLLQVVEGNPQQ